MAQYKYRELEENIRHLTLTLPTGAQLPPERQLAITYKCSFLTIRKALKSLVDEGLIYRHVGKGTYVAERKDGKPASANGSTSTSLGILIYHKNNAYAQKVLQALSQIAIEKNVDLRSAWVRNFNEEGLAKAETFAREGCKAIVLPWFPHDLTRQISSFISQSPLPVSIPLLIPGLEKNYFGAPEIFGMSLIHSTEALCRYFQKLGHTKIALLGPSVKADSILQKMLTTYTCHILSQHLPNLVGLVTPDTDSMMQLAQHWKVHKGDLAIISYDDEHALRFMTAMHKLGLNASEDFNIIGHNDMEASRFSDPPLSSIAQDFEEVSQGLLKNALALAEGGSFHDDFSPVSRLLVRETCGGLNRITQEFRRHFPDLELIPQSRNALNLPELVST